MDRRLTRLLSGAHRPARHGFFDDLNPTGVYSEAETVAQKSVHGCGNAHLIGPGLQLKSERARTTSVIGQDFCIENSSYGAKRSNHVIGVSTGPPQAHGASVTARDTGCARSIVAVPRSAYQSVGVRWHLVTECDGERAAPHPVTRLDPTASRCAPPAEGVTDR